MKKKRKSEEEEEAAPELTGLPSTATMMSPRTMLPAKPLVVGRSPAFAARLPPGTFGGEAEEQSQAVSPARGRRRRRRRRGGGGGGCGESSHLQHQRSVPDVELARDQVRRYFRVQPGADDLRRRENATEEESFKESPSHEEDDGGLTTQQGGGSASDSPGRTGSAGERF